ncbi:TonB-dependent receptor [Aestuariibacter salexigens]|uniref:TonB-dependent receptor n=1 Tax=Aestuariibacter salexigens TaxID=226010 RepID=UPI00041F6065|nr:TonB-dependent receptor plug domain-containing protein [Aestuariibacter salexigens]
MRAISFILCFFSISVYAQDTSLFDLSLEELLEINLAGDVVSSLELNKRPETGNAANLTHLQLPKSIEIMNSDSISARGISNVIEVAENMTGIISGESPSEPYSFSFRGFSRDSVNMVYDGISIGVATYNTRPLNTFNIKQVEITKGPVVLTAGQGGASGTINIVSKKARLVKYHTRELLVSAGKFDSKSVNLGLSGPLNDRVGYRVDLSRNSSDGWVDDSYSFATDLSASLLWQLSTSVELFFSIKSHKDELPAYWGTPFVPEHVARSPNSNVITGDNGFVIDETTRLTNYNVTDHEISSDSMWNRIDLTWRAGSEVLFKSSLYSFNADRRWKNAENYFYNTSIAEVERDRLLVEHDRKNWGAQAQLSFQHDAFGNNKTTLIAGYHVINFDRNVGFNLDSPSLYWDAVDLYQPESGEFGFVDLRSDALEQRTSNVMITNVSDVSDALSLHVQLRHESIHFDRLYINWDGTVRDRSTLETTFQEQSISIGLNYQPDDNSSIYSHYVISHDPVFSDYRFVYDVANLTPSDVRQIEIGYKGVFDEQRTELTGAVYKLTKRVNTQPSANNVFFDSDADSIGLELSLNSHLSDNVSIGINAAINNTDFGHYFDPEIGLDVSGNTPVNVPEKMLNLRASYQFDELPIEIGASSNYVSSRWADSQNTVQLNSYTLHKLFLAYHGEQYYVGLHVNNVSDEIYGPWSDIYYPNQVILGPPRNIEFTFKANF